MATGKQKRTKKNKKKKTAEEGEGEFGGEGKYTRASSILTKIHRHTHLPSTQHPAKFQPNYAPSPFPCSVPLIVIFEHF